MDDRQRRVATLLDIASRRLASADEQLREEDLNDEKALRDPRIVALAERVRNEEKFRGSFSGRFAVAALATADRESWVVHLGYTLQLDIVGAWRGGWRPKKIDDKWVDPFYNEIHAKHDWFRRADGRLNEPRWSAWTEAVLDTVEGIREYAKRKALREHGRCNGPDDCYDTEEMILRMASAMGMRRTEPKTRGPWSMHFADASDLERHYYHPEMEEMEIFRTTPVNEWISENPTAFQVVEICRPQIERDEHGVEMLLPLPTPNSIDAIKSDVGSGKTHTLRRFIDALSKKHKRRLRIVVVTNRRSMGPVLREALQRDIPLHTDPEFDNGCSCIVQYESLWRLTCRSKANNSEPKAKRTKRHDGATKGTLCWWLRPSTETTKKQEKQTKNNGVQTRDDEAAGRLAPDILVLDEFESILTQGLSHVTNRKRLEFNAYVLQTMVQRATHVMAFDADLGPRGLGALHLMTQGITRPMRLVINDWLPTKPRIYLHKQFTFLRKFLAVRQLLTEPEAADELLETNRITQEEVDALNQARRVMVASGSKKFVDQYLLPHFPSDSIYHHSGSDDNLFLYDMAHLNSRIENSLLWAFTPRLTTGADCQTPMGAAFLVCHNLSEVPRVMFQMLGRARRVLGPVHVLILNPGGAAKSRHETTLEEVETERKARQKDLERARETDVWSADLDEPNTTARKAGLKWLRHVKAATKTEETLAMRAYENSFIKHAAQKGFVVEKVEEFTHDNDAERATLTKQLSELGDDDNERVQRIPIQAELDRLNREDQAANKALCEEQAAARERDKQSRQEHQQRTVEEAQNAIDTANRPGVDTIQAKIDTETGHADERAKAIVAAIAWGDLWKQADDAQDGLAHSAAKSAKLWAVNQRGGVVERTCRQLSYMLLNDAEMESNDAVTINYYDIYKPLFAKRRELFWEVLHCFDVTFPLDAWSDSRDALDNTERLSSRAVELARELCEGELGQPVLIIPHPQTGKPTEPYELSPREFSEAYDKRRIVYKGRRLFSYVLRNIGLELVNSKVKGDKTVKITWRHPYEGCPFNFRDLTRVFKPAQPRERRRRDKPREAVAGGIDDPIEASSPFTLEGVAGVIDDPIPALHPRELRAMDPELVEAIRGVRVHYAGGYAGIIGVGPDPLA